MYESIGAFLCITGGLIFIIISLLLLATLANKAIDWVSEQRKKRVSQEQRNIWTFLMLAFLAVVGFFLGLLGVLMWAQLECRGYVAYIHEQRIKTGQLTLWQSLVLKLEVFYRWCAQYWVYLYVASAAMAVLGYQIM